MVWVVTLTYSSPADEDQLDLWADQLDDVDGSIANIPGRGVDVTLRRDGPDPIEAAVSARDATFEIIHREPIGVEVLAGPEYERRADAPTLPELVSAPEAAQILNVTRQRVAQLRANPLFPAPLVELRTGPVWDRVAIEKFNREWERRPGRPRASASA